MARSFVALFGLGEDQDVRRTAMTAVGEGYAVIPVMPGGKRPICTLNSREVREADKEGRHDCSLASEHILDVSVADKVFKRLTKGGVRPNIGMVAGPSRAVIVDCDVPEEVDAFRQDWFNATGDSEVLEHSVTSQSPGLWDEEKQEWAHKDGGHFIFDLPEGYSFPPGVDVVKAPGGYDIKIGNSMVLIPPSVRPEGRYIPLSNVQTAQPWLLAMVEGLVSQVVERRAERSAMTPHDGVAAWSMATPWADLLEPAGWEDTTKLDRCGCPIWTKPGGGSTSYKSATAHLDDCPRYDNIEGHGPLHLWTTDPPEPLKEFVLSGKRTITKLDFVAAMDYSGDVTEAMQELGLTTNLDDWILPTVTTVTTVTDPLVTPVTVGDRDDRDDRDDVGVSPSVTVTDEVVTREDDRDTPAVSADAYRDAVSLVMSRLGIPPSEQPNIESKLKKAVIDQAVRMAVDIAQGRAGVGELASWFPPADFAETFTGHEAEDVPVMLSRVDETMLLYQGRVNGIVGRRGVGKTWLALLAVAQVLQAGGRVIYVDMEDRLPAWRERLTTIGCDIDTAVGEGRAVWIKPGNLPEDDDMPALVEYLASFDLVVFDVMNRLIIRKGGNPDAGNEQTAWLYDNLFDPLAGHNTCVLVLDHPNRRGQRRDADLDDLSPGGGAMKMNNASGHVIGMTPLRPFTRSQPDGHIRLLSLKDRAGHFGEGDGIGEFRGRIGMAGDSLGLELYIDLPEEAEKEEGLQADMTAVRERIITVLSDPPRGLGPTTPGALRKAITEGKRYLFEPALDALVEDGKVVEDDGRYRLGDGP